MQMRSQMDFWSRVKADKIFTPYHTLLNIQFLEVDYAILKQMTLLHPVLNNIRLKQYTPTHETTILFSVIRFSCV